MMKIKTITCQKVNNHGANLQAYALMHYLEKLGHDVEIIDYFPEYFKHFRPLYCGTPKYAANPVTRFAYICAKFPGRLKSYLEYKKSDRKKNFEAFRDKYYRLTDTYESFEELKANPPKADLYIAGSDQIWNTMMNNGKDPAYYLQFAPKNATTATYAASFSVSEIPDELKKQIKSYIESIDYISVREKTAINILEDLGVERGQVVLDPVFLLNKEQWNEIVSDKIFNEKYVLVYDFESSDIVKSFAKQYSKKNNVKIYSLYKNDYCDKCYEDYGPDVFLSLIKNASFVISNSFHATAFSIIYEKQFAVIKRQEGINSRIIDLLDSFGIDDRVVSEYRDFDNINYESTIDKRQVLIQNSKDYLNHVLAEVNG